MIYGIIIGLLISVLIFVILTYYRYKIETKIQLIDKKIKNKKGYIFESENDIDILRDKIIKENSRNGKDTPLKELM